MTDRSFHRVKAVGEERWTSDHPAGKMRITEEEAQKIAHYLSGRFDLPITQVKCCVPRRNQHRRATIDVYENWMKVYPRGMCP